MEHLQQHIEAIIFSSEKPVSVQEIIDCLNNLEEDTFYESAAIEEALEKIQERFDEKEFAFGLVFTGGGYQFLTKADYHRTVSIFLNQKAKKRLSTAALETLAIIAYKQPVGKTEVEQIRGVNCDYTINKLLEKELITIEGRDDTPGRPILYGLSETFMDYFGINSVEDLPKPKEIQPAEDNTIGEKAE